MMRLKNIAPDLKTLSDETLKKFRDAARERQHVRDWYVVCGMMLLTAFAGIWAWGASAAFLGATALGQVSATLITMAAVMAPAAEAFAAAAAETTETIKLVRRFRVKPLPFSMLAKE